MWKLHYLFLCLDSISVNFDFVFTVVTGPGFYRFSGLMASRVFSTRMLVYPCIPPACSNSFCGLLVPKVKLFQFPPFASDRKFHTPLMSGKIFSLFFFCQNCPQNVNVTGCQSLWARRRVSYNCHLSRFFENECVKGRVVVWLAEEIVDRPKRSEDWNRLAIDS